MVYMLCIYVTIINQKIIYIENILWSTETYPPLTLKWGCFGLILARKLKEIESFTLCQMKARHDLGLSGPLSGFLAIIGFL